MENEANLRQAKLNKASKLKEELQARLDLINKSIENLKPEDPVVQKKPKLLSSEDRKEHQLSEHKKAEAIAKKLKKYTKQQKAIEEGILKQLKKIEKKVKQQKDEEKFNEQYEIFMRKERIKEEREKMIEKRQKRMQEKQELNKVKSEPNVYLTKKPLFQKYEEKFNNEIMMPELERRKEELRKKREMLSPLSSDKLKDHVNWYESFRDSRKQKFEKEMNRKLLEQKKREFELLGNVSRTFELNRNDSEQRLKQKIKLIEKGKNYAEIAKQLYNPFLDSDKTPVKKLGKKQKSSVKEFKSDGELSDRIRWKPKKFKPNALVPQQKPEKKIVIIKDYLAENRLKHENSQKLPKSLTLSPSLATQSLSQRDLDSFKKRASKIDKLVRERSSIIKITPNSLLSLTESESLDSLLLESIKCKLSLISSISKKV